MSLTLAMASRDTAPRELAKRDWAPAVSRPPWEVSSTSTACGPDSSMASHTASAISPRASSQEMRSHAPEPRSPTRRIGCSRRSSAVSWRCQAAPFWQPIGLGSGTPASPAGYTPDCSSHRTAPSPAYIR